MSGFKPGSEEYWTIEHTIQAMDSILNHLKENGDICFLGELQMECEWAEIIDSNTIHYLIYNKYKDNIDVQNYMNKIDRVLEFRCAKTRKMYPGIAAMALKNKHKWVDKTEVKQDISGGLDLKSLLGTKDEDE